MTRSAYPPQPSVEHLTTIFRRIDSGKIVVPAFQRTFVWELADIIALLESVYKGYPIGRLLLWAVDHDFLRVSDSSEIPFPKSKPEFPLSYVLDGLQRLSSLYGVFHFGDRTEKNSSILSSTFWMRNSYTRRMLPTRLRLYHSTRSLTPVVS